MFYSGKQSFSFAVNAKSAFKLHVWQIAAIKKRFPNALIEFDCIKKWADTDNVELKIRIS